MGNRAVTLISATILTGLMVSPGLAAPPALKQLPASLRAQILSEGSPEQLCRIEALESRFGFQFKAGTPSPVLDEVQAARAGYPNNPCAFASLAEAQAAGALDVKVADAKSFLASLPALETSYEAMCGFKHRVASVAKKSAATFERNFASKKELFTPGECRVSDAFSPYVLIHPEFPSCPQAAVSAAWFVECFRSGNCTGDCAVGATAAELNLLYDVYDNDGNGKLEGREREAFDDAFYPGEAVAGVWTGDGEKGIDDTLSGTHGRKTVRKYRETTTLAQQGPVAYTGVLMSMSAKGAYRKKVLAGEIQVPEARENLGQNGMIVSVTPEAAKALKSYTMVDRNQPQGNAHDALVTQFEKDFAEIRALLRKLPYAPVGPDGRPRGQLAYEQFTSYKNFDPIMKGELQLLFPAHLELTDEAMRDLEKLFDKLDSPTLNGIEVVVHPLGRIKLAQLVLYMVHHHPDANSTFNLTRTSMNHEQPCRYFNSVVDQCMGRTRADRERAERAAAKKAGVPYQPTCQATSVEEAG